MNYKNLLSFLILILSTGYGNTLNSQPIDYNFSSSRKLVTESMQKFGILGMQITIISKNSILWKENSGYADFKNKIPVSDSTMFRIGSISNLLLQFL